MQRRLRIIMDENYNINADGVTNWVGPNEFEDGDSFVEWLVKRATETNRDTLVLQPRKRD